MRKIEVKMELKIKFYDAFFFGGGTGNGNIQSYLMRDIHGYPYISGAALKGCISDSANALSEVYPISYRKNVLFGIGGTQQGRLFFGNGKLQNPEEYRELEQYIVDLRTGVSISRYTKTKKEGHLFTMETSGQGGRMVFKSDIYGFLDEKTYKEEIAYLAASARFLFALGGGKSSGLGWLAEPMDCNVYANECLIKQEDVYQWIKKITCS